jgi:hypothetical protein
MAKNILREEIENLEKNFIEKFDKMNEKATLKNFDEITKKTIEFFDQLKTIVLRFHKLKQSQFKYDDLNLPIFDCFCSTVYTNINVAKKSFERNLSQFSTMKQLLDRLEIKNMIGLKTIENKSLPVHSMNNKIDYRNSVCTPLSFNNNNNIKVDLKENKSVKIQNEHSNLKENINSNPNKNNKILVPGNNGLFLKPNPVNQNPFSPEIKNRIVHVKTDNPFIHSNSLPNGTIPNKSENQKSEENHDNQEKGINYP